MAAYINHELFPDRQRSALGAHSVHQLLHHASRLPDGVCTPHPGHIGSSLADFASLTLNDSDESPSRQPRVYGHATNDVIRWFNLPATTHRILTRVGNNYEQNVWEVQLCQHVPGCTEDLARHLVAAMLYDDHFARHSS